MMRIGITTINDYHNYGNRLQNYAVNQILRTRFDCKTETLEGDNLKAPYQNIPGWIKETVARRLSAFPNVAKRYLKNETIRWAAFWKWSNKHIPTRRFYNCKQLPNSLNDEYDVFFSGSDQVWNYNFLTTRFSDVFLKFAEPKKRASISASFGVEMIPEEKRQYYIDSLSGFSHISVREDAGAKIVKDLLGKDVPVLVDPVMILGREEWLKVADKPKVDCSKPYVLKYCLGDEGADRVDSWAQKNGLAVYELLNENQPEVYYSGPGEFISLISNASLVCSDSFHCIAFSIIFQKPFLVVEREGEGNYMLSRLVTLLNKFGLQDRWARRVDEKDYMNCDFSGTEVLLQAEQKKFLDYIAEVLRGCTE